MFGFQFLKATTPMGLAICAALAVGAFGFHTVPNKSGLDLAQTQGMNKRQDRRDDRQGDRDDRRDDRQDCRQEEGAVGNDKRDCKQDERQDRNNDDSSTSNDG